MVFTINHDQTSVDICQQTLNEYHRIAHGITLAKNLGNLPGNVCTPTYLADEAKKLSKQFSTIKTKILEEKHMEKLGMGALLSVSRGSHEPAKFIIMEYHGPSTKNEKPIVLVGKGITFDSGGISIKPSANMDEMKYDMCGAASVFGTFHALASCELPLHVIGIVAASENLLGSQASKPGDIVSSMSGQTIEILNTDAEGRLVLCDALTYAEQYDPDVVLDMATLTGAMVVALGSPATGFFSNHQPLADALLQASNDSADRAWQLPLWDDYQEAIESPFADFANVGNREAGSITAACFLARFCKKFHWAHLDIAGTAWKTGKEKGATGRPVGLLMHYLMQRCH